MRRILSGVLVINMAACLVAAVISFGAVSVEAAAPLYALAILMALFWAAKLCLADRVSWKQSPLHLPVLAVMVYAAIRYFTSELEYESRLELFHVVLYGFVYFAAAFNCHRSGDRRILIGTLLGLAVAQTSYGFWQFATESPYVLHLQRPQQYLGRAGGTFVCPNHLAGFLELVLGLVLARITIIRSAKKGSLQKFALKKVFVVYLALMIVAGLVATLSRAGWVSTLIGFMVFLVLKGWQTKTVWPRVVVGALGSIVIVVIVWRLDPVKNFIHVNVVDNIRQSAEESDLDRVRNVGTRLSMWGATCRLIGADAGNMVFGTGPGTWTWYHLEYRDPRLQMRPRFVHNDYLHLASDYGLVGVLLVGWVLVAFFYHASKFLSKNNSSDQRSFAAGSIVALVIMLVHSIFDFNMHIPANALLVVMLMGFTSAMDDGDKRYTRIALRSWQRYGLAGVLLALAVVAVVFYGRTYLGSRYTSKGNEAKDGVQWAEAVEWYNKALKYDPLSPEPHARLGDVYQSHSVVPTLSATEREKALNYAISMYDASLILNPLQSDVMVKMAVAFAADNQTENALVMFKEALAIDPENAFTHFKMGQFYQDRQEIEKASKAFRRSRDLNPWSDRGAYLNLEEIKPGSGN